MTPRLKAACDPPWPCAPALGPLLVLRCCFHRISLTSVVAALTVCTCAKKPRALTYFPTNTLRQQRPPQPLYCCQAVEGSWRMCNAGGPKGRAQTTCGRRSMGSYPRALGQALTLTVQGPGPRRLSLQPLATHPGPALQHSGPYSWCCVASSAALRCPRSCCPDCFASPAGPR